MVPMSYFGYTEQDLLDAGDLVPDPGPESAFYLEVDVATGAIVAEHRRPRGQFLTPGPAGPTEIVEVGAEALGLAATHYWLDGAVTPRPPLPAQPSAASITADGADEVTLDLPGPARVEVWRRGQLLDVLEVGDGRLELSLTLPGSYTLRVDCPPCLVTDFPLEATAP